MAAPDPEGMTLLGKILGAATAVVVPVWGARTWIEKRFSSKADKEEVDKTFVILHGELSRQRDVQAKIFDKIEANEKASASRHSEILTLLIRNKQ